MPRPRYQTIIDEIGMKKSLPAAPEHFEWRVNPRLDDAPVVFLGLGPEPDKLPEWFDLPEDEVIFFLEDDRIIDQFDDWAEAVPEQFERITPEEFTRESAANAHVVRYLPVQRAYPSYYSPLTARLTLGAKPLPRLDKTVWLPTADDDLLVRELSEAFRAKGYTPILIDHENLGKHPGSTLPQLLQEGVPDLFFSINFKGLDHFGLGQAILKEAGCQIAVWMVDNPFNLLPAVKSEYWRETRLFVTDHTFIGPLIETGARWVTHLPLAASPALFEREPTLPDHASDVASSLVFVGRSAFPAQERFFAGITVPQELAQLASATPHSERCDYHWWREHMGITPLWPGNQVRAIGAGAEFASGQWKRECLNAAGKITIFGDDGWKNLENEDAEARGVVDYYDHLPALYKAAAVTINITGMQLPAGLTQRHFDVWCAGGFLITDTHPGLSIFPDELVDPIRYTRPDQIRDLYLRFREDTETKRTLRDKWRECILAEHTYDNRVDTIITAMNL